jgi:hypothetical protein
MRRIALLVLVFASTAHADKADALFKKAKKQLAEKRYPEACATFEQVDKLDPGIGAKLNVGKCYEEWGKLALAYRWYTDAETMATAAKDDRAAKIHALAEELDTNVPRMTLKIPDGADPDIVETVTLDGKPVSEAVFGIEQRVDPGAHVIELTIDGKVKKKVVPVERGGSSEISLDIPKGTGKKGDGWKAKKRAPNGEEPKPDPDKPIVVTPPAPGRNQRIAGIVVGASGVVAIGIAGGITLSARGKYKDALSAHCMGSTSMCDDEGVEITHDARHTANIATVVTIIGGAAVIGGVVLYLTAPKGGRVEEHALRITPAVGADGASVILDGRF